MLNDRTHHRFFFAWLIATLIAQAGFAAAADDNAGAAAGFTYPADGVGKLLAERLTPQAPAIRPLPPASEPKPREASRFESLPDKLPGLSAIVWHQSPQVLPQDRLTFNRQTPAFDGPALAAELDPARPLRPELPTQAKVSVAGPDPSQLKPLGHLASTVRELAAIGDDATLATARQWQLSPLPPLRTAASLAPDPALRDPFELIATVELRHAPLETEIIAGTPERPERPMFVDNP